jgi:hypothetical protein
MAQVIIEGRVSNDVWGHIINHLSEFQLVRPDLSDLRLRAIHQGVLSSVLYLEADHELSLAAYLAEFADLAGTGSVELFEKLGEIVAAKNLRAAISQSAGDGGRDSGVRSSRRTVASGRIDALEKTPFWKSEKAFAILTSTRKIWFEACSNDLLTLRPPRGSVTGLDLIQGRFVATSVTNNSHSAPDK